ncbi:MAG: COX15/CtaA family protein [Thiobacillus sp.]|nr:COX15/CtaA family protein [Thiobacillus sp.]
MTFYRNLVLAALILAFTMVGLGTYARQSGPGVGCSDWPDCYGKPVPHQTAGAGNTEFGARLDGPVSRSRTWKQTAHLYLAGSLGGLLALIAVLNWRGRRETQGGLGLPLLLLALMAFQALLSVGGATPVARPLVDGLHRLGGMATFALLLWLWLRERPQFSHAYFARADHLRSGAMIGLLLVIAQIALGGWVSTNYAALACSDFPLCQGRWVPLMDFANGFALLRGQGETTPDTALPMAALTAIHWTHRLMALMVTLYLGGLMLRLMRSPGYVDLGLMVGALLALQWVLGLSYFFTGLPLVLTMAHSAGAALLLSSMVLLNYRIRRR